MNQAKQRCSKLRAFIAKDPLTLLGNVNWGRQETGRQENSKYGAQAPALRPGRTASGWFARSGNGKIAF
jgi:hypothetical protein